MKSRMRLGLSLGMLMVAALLAGGCGGGSQDELVVGVYGSLTGNDATFGQSTKNGVALAVDELEKNAQGRIGGLKLRTVVDILQRFFAMGMLMNVMASMDATRHSAQWVTACVAPAWLTPSWG